ncbi:MAG: hypothetical protein M3T49_05280 [Candidatus Eremiobacteraeota bacterium]|nr:hypothetical protein [Candidatus Eremiobacteraeota bacterium]
MFSQFSPAARAVVTLAEQESRNASHYYLGTEHLLLAMVIAPSGDVAQHLEWLGLEPWQVKRALRDATGGTFEHSWEGIIVTERVKRIFRLATARAQGAKRVEPMDLLHAIIADGRGLAARVLAGLGGPMAAAGKN